MLDNKEREFYQSTIASLLHYNGMLITKLFTQGQMPPIPPNPIASIPNMFGIDLTLNPEDMKKLSNAWKDFPPMFPKSSFVDPKDIMDIMRKMSMVPEPKDDQEDPLK